MMDIAVIGTGGIAQKAYFPLLAVMPEINISAVLSRTQEHANQAAERWAIPFATNKLDEIVARQPRAALVISSTESHFAICKLLMENGVDVYVEKPLTTSSQQSQQLSQIAKNHSRILAVGFNRRYALLYQQAKSILSNQKIELAVIKKHRTTASNPSLFEHYLDDTIHQIDLMRYYCGDVEAIQTTYQKADGVLVTANSTVKLPGGGMGTIMVCNQTGAWQESATIHTKGISLHVDAFERLRVMHDGHETVYGTDRAGKWVTAMKERGFWGELDHFFDCVRTRETPQTSAQEALKTQRLMEDLVTAAGDPLPT